MWQKNTIEVFLTAFCGPGFLRKFRHSRCVSCTKVAAPVFRVKPTLSSAPVVHWGLARIRRRTLCRLGSFALGPCGGLSLAHMSGQRAEPVCCRGHHRSRSLDFPHEQSAAARTSFTTRGSDCLVPPSCCIQNPRRCEWRKFSCFCQLTETSAVNSKK